MIATGVQYSVRQFVEFAAEELGIKLIWRGDGVDEEGVVSEVIGKEAKWKPGDVIVKVDPRYFRPTEVETLLGDPSKAKEALGWEPEITVQEMCSEMVAEDLKVAQRHALLKNHGHDIAVSVEG